MAFNATPTDFSLWLASGFTSFKLDFGGGAIQFDVPIEGFKFYVSQLTPHAHAITGYYDLMIYGAIVAQLLPNIVVLLGFAVTFLSVAIWRFKFASYTARNLFNPRITVPLL